MACEVNIMDENSSFIFTCNVKTVPVYDFRETCKTEIMFTSTFVRKNKRRSMMRQILRQINFVGRHTPMVVLQNYCVVRQKLLAIR